MLTLVWSDGCTFLPVNSCLVASSKELNIIGPVKNFDKRTIAGKRRSLAQMKVVDSMLASLDTAMSSGISADYVLYDSWFSNPSQIISIKNKGLDTIATINKNRKIKYTYEG